MSPTFLTISFCVFAVAGIALAIVTRRLRKEISELKEKMKNISVESIREEVQKEFEAHKEEIKKELMDEIMVEKEKQEENA